MLASLVVGAFLLLQVGAQQDPNVFCFNCLKITGYKYFWPVDGDCHSFYHCFYFNSTYATGIIQKCPPGTYYHDEVMQCMPEGSVACSDQCQNDAVQAQGCYGVPTSCSTYYVCSNTASYGMCCPAGTAFDASTCSCETSETCTDACALQAPPAPTTVNPVQVFSDHCIDSWGVTLYPNNADSTQYFIYDSNTDGQTAMSCAPGSSFSLSACECSVAVEYANAPSDSICEFYAPFDKDIHDHSPSKYIGKNLGHDANAAISNTVYAYGGGSINFAAPTLGIGYAGVKNYDFGYASSFCFFYQCTNSGSGNANSCTATATVLANTNNPSELQCTLNFASQAGDNFWGNVSFDRPISNQIVQGPVNTNGNYAFNQVCVVYDGSNLQLYLNNNLQQTVQVKGHLKIAQCALYVGYGHQFGGFVGYIDEVLVCRRALSANEVAAHYNGQTTMRQAGLIL